MIRKATTGPAAPLPADRTAAGNLGRRAISGPAWRQPTPRSQVRGAAIGPADRDRGAHPHASRRTIALTTPDRSKRSAVRARPVKLPEAEARHFLSGGPTRFGTGTARSARLSTHRLYLRRNGRWLAGLAGERTRRYCSNNDLLSDNQILGPICRGRRATRRVASSPSFFVTGAARRASAGSTRPSLGFDDSATEPTARADGVRRQVRMEPRSEVRALGQEAAEAVRPRPAAGSRPAIAASLLGKIHAPDACSRGPTTESVRMAEQLAIGTPSEGRSRSPWLSPFGAFAEECGQRGRLRPSWRTTELRVSGDGPDRVGRPVGKGFTREERTRLRSLKLASCIELQESLKGVKRLVLVRDAALAAKNSTEMRAVASLTYIVPPPN